MVRHRRAPFVVDWSHTPLDPALDNGLPPMAVARDMVRDAAADHGGHCKCCGQDVKLYRRPMTSAMAAALIQLYRYYKLRGWPNWPNLDFVHVAVEVLAKAPVSAELRASWHGGDWQKLRFWELIERMAGERDDGSDRVGMYRLTEGGRDFVERRVSVPRYAFFYAQIFMGHDPPLIVIEDALDTPFDFRNI